MGDHAVAEQRSQRRQAPVDDTHDRPREYGVQRQLRDRRVDRQLPVTEEVAEFVAPVPDQVAGGDGEPTVSRVLSDRLRRQQGGCAREHRPAGEPVGPQAPTGFPQSAVPLDGDATGHRQERERGDADELRPTDQRAGDHYRHECQECPDTDDRRQPLPAVEVQCLSFLLYIAHK
ncbi:MAG: hypothetical protein ACI9HI_001885 [Salinirussus sp.]